MTIPILSGLLLLLLFLVAAISMAEASFFSIPRLTLTRLKQEQQGLRAAPRGIRTPRDRARRIALVDRLLDKPAHLLGTILVSDTLVSVALSSVTTLCAVIIARRLMLSEALTILVASVVLFFVLLLVGETLPKLVALRNPLRIASGLAPSVAFVDRVFAPLSRYLDRWAARLLKLPKPVPFPTEAELKTMLEIGRERGTIKGSEEEILWNLTELGRRTVAEIMTPRIDIKALRGDLSVSEAMVVARTAAHSRLPVYSDTIDRVTGIFYIKDYFRLHDDSTTVLAASREPYLIPEAKRLPALLDEFRRLGIHVAVVVDEFGQTAGLVTLEDVLEVLFGEIRDEYDVEEKLPYVRMPDGSYSVDGDIDLRTLNRIFRHGFRGLGPGRLSGFIHDRLGRLAEAGDRLEHHGLEIVISDVTEHQIQRVLIRRIGDGDRKAI